MEYGVPLMVIPVRVKSSSPAPLIFPLAAALTTDPETGEEEGIAVSPLMLIGVETEAVKVSPVLLFLELKACPSRTEMLVPAGITTGGGGGGG